jgi:N-acetylmuramoyl-L-alanine amidase
MRKITRLVVHTAAFRPDVGAKTIDAWHRARGWRKIGYHLVIRKDGAVERGRGDEEIGAGVEGMNADTLHVCCTGHGDLDDFTPAQKKSLVRVLIQWLEAYGMVEAFRANPMRILGHRECYALMGQKQKKTCPGNKVDMREIRLLVLEELK